MGEPDHDACVRIVHRALDAGINVVDTADIYSRGESEEIVGKALRARRGSRDEVVLATKFGSPMDVGDARSGPGDPNHQGTSRRWIVRELEASLRRLGTDHVDLYQVHRPAKGTDEEETLAALTDLQRAGEIRAFGTSTYPASRMVESQWVSERRALGRYVSEQPPYSILDRGIEREVLPVAQRYRMGVLTWSPLAYGWLAGRHRRGQEPPTSHRSAMNPDRFDPAVPGNRDRLDAVEQLALLAEDAGVTMVHLALAFVLRHPGVTAPIVGPRTLDQLEGQLGAVDVRLSDDVLDRIDEIVPPGSTVADDGNTYVTAPLRDPALRRR